MNGLAKQKFYAVRQGRVPGIYKTWAECQEQTTGFSGAVFKSFESLAEAEDFMNGANQFSHSSSKAKKMNDKAVGTFSHADSDAEVKAYIDGSFDKVAGIVGSGGVIIYENGLEEQFSFGANDPKYVQFWNVSGELLAARYAVEKAIEAGAKSIALFYDYMGIEMWATKAWKANNEVTQEYAHIMSDYSHQIRIDFHKVKAHSGIEYNEAADYLAKQGVANFGK